MPPELQDFFVKLMGFHYYGPGAGKGQTAFYIFHVASSFVQKYNASSGYTHFRVCIWLHGHLGLRMQQQAQLMISEAEAPRLVSCGYMSWPPGRVNGSYWSTVTPSIAS